MTARTKWIGAGVLLIVLSQALAADWPQWRGPNRDGVSAEKGLLQEWPKGGPKLLWKAKDIGKGYSTPSVVGGRVYVLSDDGSKEFVVALGAKDGKELWKAPVGKVGPNRGPQYPGSRSTPTVEGDVLYVLGSDGDLVCLETAKGKEKWRKSLRTDFGGRPGMWAYSESVLIDGDVLVCTPGGSKATLAALKKKDGEVVWRAAVPGGDTAAYASPMIAEAGKVRQYVQFLEGGVVGVDAKTGKFLWRYKGTVGGRPVNIPTPIVHDGHVFSTSGTGGAGLVKLTADTDGGVTAKQVYHTRDLSSHSGGAIRVGDSVYGTGGGSLVCVDFATGKLQWKDRSVGSASHCYADGRLYVRGERGGVALVETDPKAYKERGRFDQPDRSKRQAWPYPVVADGCLFLRDQDVLLCYDVRAKAKE